jgi:predicted heme/steroid binding protein
MNQHAKHPGALLAVFTASILLLAACAAPAATPAPATAAPTNAATPVVTSEATTAPEGKVFTLDELAKFDGKNGNPAYIAVDGVVYDVTNVPEWKGGSHWGRFFAGKDLTTEIKTLSPHGVSKLKGVPVVGTLAK